MRNETHRCFTHGNANLPKRAYATFDDAHAATVKHPERLNAYKCDEHGWHIGHGVSKSVFDESNLLPLFAPLADDLVNEDAYGAAAAAGVDAVPDLPHVEKPKPGDIADVWIGKTRKYANDFPARLAQNVSTAAFNAQTADGSSDDSVLSAAGDAIEAMRSDALLYSEPPYGTGNHAYGQTLQSSDVLMDWEIEPEACDICAPMPEGNPYELASLPMWPGDPHPNCRCSITPDDETWQSIFGAAAGD